MTISNEMTGGEALARMLQAHGVGPMFGMGGFQLAPRPYMSERAVAASPSHISGARYCGVPTMRIGFEVSSVSCRGPARPKSASLITPARVSRRFCGFTSRWMTPIWCAWASASATTVA